MASSVRTGPSRPGMQVFAIPAVVLLVLFLGYSSQLLFHIAPDLQPGPPSTTQTVVFNLLLLNLWWNYYKACTVSPGTYTFRRPFSPSPETEPKPEPMPTRDERPQQSQQARQKQQQQQRWCKKCASPKPARAHHCRHCGRCIPKMDHHCPWTGNCVSMQTFPYFMRFLVATNAALWFLAWAIYLRFRALFDDRHLPSYLGPTIWQLAHLTVLAIVCAFTCFALLVMVTTTAKSWVENRTMIEDWEVERHEALLRRHGACGSSSAGQGSTWWAIPEEEEDDDEDEDEDGEEDDDGQTRSLRMRRIEFPYDVGYWRNMSQAMGTANPLAWFWPFAGGPVISTSPDQNGTGWDWEENGFNPHEGMWPPPDPEKDRRATAGGWPGAAGAGAGPLLGTQYANREEELAAFRARQEKDLRRRRWQSGASGIIAELEETEELADLGADEEPDHDDGFDDSYSYYEKGLDGEPGWTNRGGDRLRDYGVDEDSDDEQPERVRTAGQAPIPVQRASKVVGDYGEDDDDDDVPLGELIRRRKATSMREGFGAG